MAKRKFTTRRSARANPTITVKEIVAKTDERVDACNRWVGIFTQQLAKLMQEMHGGEYRIQIEHDVGLIVVARRLSAEPRPIEKANLREAV